MTAVMTIGVKSRDSPFLLGQRALFDVALSRPEGGRAGSPEVLVRVLVGGWVAVAALVVVHVLVLINLVFVVLRTRVLEARKVRQHNGMAGVSGKESVERSWVDMMVLSRRRRLHRCVVEGEVREVARTSGGRRVGVVSWTEDLGWASQV